MAFIFVSKTQVFVSSLDSRRHLPPAYFGTEGEVYCRYLRSIIEDFYPVLQVGKPFPEPDSLRDQGRFERDVLCGVSVALGLPDRDIGSLKYRPYMEGEQFRRCFMTGQTPQGGIPCRRRSEATADRQRDRTDLEVKMRLA